MEPNSYLVEAFFGACSGYKSEIYNTEKYHNEYGSNPAIRIKFEYENRGYTGIYVFNKYFDITEMTESSKTFIDRLSINDRIEEPDCFPFANLLLSKAFPRTYI